MAANQKIHNKIDPDSIMEIYRKVFPSVNLEYL